MSCWVLQSISQLFWTGKAQRAAMECLRNVALSFCFAHARCLVPCSSYSYLLTHQMPTWTNLINGIQYFFDCFFPLLCMSLLLFWMEFNYDYSTYYFGSFYCPINTHICIINIDITLMFYSAQYVKTISGRSHPLLLVSNVSCPFKVKKFAAWACLLAQVSKDKWRWVQCPRFNALGRMNRTPFL